MKIYIREILLHHLLPGFGFSHKHKIVVFISGNMPVFGVNKLLQLLFVITVDPDRFEQTNRLETARSSILMFQPVLYHFKLQMTHRTYHFFRSKLVGTSICNTFIHQLRKPFIKLILFHGITVYYFFENVREKTGEAFENVFFTFVQGIADFEVAGVI